jgi:hypothetical protein
MAEMNSPIRVTERDTHWEVDANRRRVTRCCIDSRFTFDIYETEFIFAVSFEGEFTYITADETGDMHEYRLEAGVAPNSLCPALSILHKQIELVTASKTGDLAVRFSDGSVLTAAPHPRYESWNISGAGGLLIVCAPGGELSVWLPQ